MYRKFYVSLSLISALALLVFTLFAAYKELSPEWKRYQAEYKKLFIENAKDKAAREKAESLETGIQQIYLGRLKRVDRCTNCHMGVENPLMAEAKIPFKQHSGNYLNDHPVDRFGCTICHYGQGNATNTKEAHGRGRDTHWDYPIVPLKYIQGSCAQCHDFEMLKQNGGDMVVRGEELFREKGCKGCHKLNDIGGVLGKALEGVGSQPIAYFQMNHVKVEKTVYSWLKQHFDDPRKIVPESKMLVEIKDNEADILTTYMLTLRSEEVFRAYRRIEHMKEIEPDGESLFKMYCIACHIKEAMESVNDKIPKQTISAIINPAREGRESINDKILKQRIPAIMNPEFRRAANNRFLRNVIHEGRAGTLMTSWKTDAAGLADEEINRIAGYITKDRPASDKQSVSGEMVAKRISEDIPDNPDDALWNRTAAFRVPLMRISQKTDPNVKALTLEVKGLITDSMEGFINVKALYNEKDIAFLLEWKDATNNELLDVDIFRDSVALQFPAQNTPEPTYRMGKGEGKNNKGMVNIWFWKAGVQGPIDKGTRSRIPAENLAAGGFGTLTLKDSDSQHVFGKGKWKDGKWSVVFKRTFSSAQDNANFAVGNFTPVSFAVWDGGEDDVDGRKSVSVWYYVIPEG
jgi:DMSO reductase family type II enzyme heme b subunit